MDLRAESLVVRGGSNRDAASLMDKIAEAVEDECGAVLSVFCGTPADGEAREETLRRICAEAKLPHPKVQVALAGELATVGVTLAWDTSDGQARNHYNATFTEPVRESQVHGFISCFDGPMPNPTGGRKGRAL